MRNQRKRYACGYALGFAIFCIISALISLILIIPMMNFSLPLPSKNTSAQVNLTVVIDAGHGGEDGGCEVNGLIEKDLNLDIALLLAQMLESEGVSVVLTRETDILLYDKNDNYEGRKKALDLRRRAEITESCENPIFVSIHMNYFAQTKYSGLQVWYSKNNARSRILANLIQSHTKSELQPKNNRTIKEATSSIFLLHNLSCPAVLVECGFLSNPDDARALADDEYRQKLVNVIFRAIMDYISQNNT